jgi:hypothetical protein
MIAIDCPWCDAPATVTDTAVECPHCSINVEISDATEPVMVLAAA